MIQNHAQLIEKGFDNLPWVDWTPIITSGVGSYTTTTVQRARYRKMGRILHYHLHIVVNSVGTGSGFVIATNPPGITFFLNLVGQGREINRTGNMLQCQVSNAGGFVISTYDNGVPVSVDGDTVVVNGIVLVQE